MAKSCFPSADCSSSPLVVMAKPRMDEGGENHEWTRIGANKVSICVASVFHSCPFVVVYAPYPFAVLTAGVHSRFNC
jgi:hypothetical protein